LRDSYSGSRFISDPETIEFLQQLDVPLYEIISGNYHDEYTSTFRNWITNSKLNTFVDFEKFSFSVFSHGTTESFDKFHIRHSDRRFRFFKADYAYHKLCYRNFEFLENDVLNYRDAVVISLPFSDTGQEYSYDLVLKQAESLGVPVLVDCCWFGVCSNINFNFSYKCIEAITFSLSKTFPVSRFRIGIRFSKKELQDGLEYYTRDNYTNNLSQFIGISFMNNFSSDYISIKYKEKQTELCQRLNITPSKTVLLGLGDDRWRYLNRGGQHNRICISDFLVD